MVSLPIYLDNLATTRTDPRVVAAMIPFFTEIYGNAASISHRFGWDADEAVKRSRQNLAQALGAHEREIVFTSGATEANNLAIRGVAESLKSRKRHLITTNAEHRAILDPMRRLQREGWSVTYLPCDPSGVVHADQVREAITEETALVSVIYANNEIGTINPISDIGRICHEHKAWFHTDATQAVGKIPVNVVQDQVDLLSFSAHKFYGPKGVGGLYVRRRDPQVRLTPLFDGGGHERGVRSGTLAVPLIVGMAEAVQLATDEMEDEARRVQGLRERLYAGILERLPDTILNGHPTERLPGNLNLSFAGVEGEALMMAMRDVAVSSGSACTSAEPEPSHVLLAIGRNEDQARASLRFGVGRFNTVEEIEFTVRSVVEAVNRLRGQNSRALRDGP